MEKVVVIDNFGIRIDKYLMNSTEYTRNKIQKLINDGDILVNEKKVKTN